MQAQDTPLILHQGVLFGAIPYGQVRSYCGQLTPHFFTKEMGLRNLTIGSEGSTDPDDPPFKPWKRYWVEPLAEQIRESDLPATFADFSARLNRLRGRGRDGGQVDFLKEQPQFGQARGFIKVGMLIPSADTVVTLGMGVPMLQKLVDQGRITDREAIFVAQAMVASGINEMVHEEYYRQNRWPYYARFAWETYHTDEVIKRFL